MARILVCDDKEAIRRVLAQVLELEQHEIFEACDGVDAMARIRQYNPDVVIMDVRMPQMDGMEALEKLQLISNDIPIIMISGHGDIDMAVECVKKGAFDFIAKPLDMHRLQITVRNALDRNNLVVKNKTLVRRVTQGKVQEMIGGSTSMLMLKDDIKTIAKHDARVLISGPNGSGKELVARSIHMQSQRNDRPIVEVNCAAIPSELIESELFGHVKGSFTGAYKDHTGKFEQANGGTLFLDEIGDMPLAAQAKMLRALQEGKITKVGGDKDVKVDVRVISATNKDLEVEIAAGRFREDLFHRLQVVPLVVPSLNERRDDIPMLISHFLAVHCNDEGVQDRAFTDEAMRLMQEFNWTGNIRQLSNAVNRLVILGSPEITESEVKRHVTLSGRNGIRANTNITDVFTMFQTQDEMMRFVEDEYIKFQSTKI